MNAPKKRVHKLNTDQPNYDELDLDFTPDEPEPDDTPLAQVIPLRRPR